MLFPTIPTHRTNSLEYFLITLDPELAYFLSSSFAFEIICRSLARFAPLSGRPFMTHCFVCSWWFGASPSTEKFHATAAIEAGLVWKGELGVLLLAGGSETVPKIRLVASYVKGMLACVVDCSQICRARSTSRRTGCEGKLWPAERDYDQDVLIRAFSSSIGYSEGSCTARSESRRCLDGSYEQSDCINAGKDDHESEDEGVENDTGSEKQPQEEQGGEEKHAQVTNTDQVRELRIEAEGEDKKPGLQLCSYTSSYRVTSDYTTRMPAKSTESLLINSRGTHLESVERALGRLTEAVTTELGHSLSVRFGEGSGSIDHITNSGGRGKEPQLAERRSRSHEFFGERLGVVGSRDERSGVQLVLSSSWGDDLRGSEEQVSFQGEDTVECNTNVVEENDFEFDVEEFQTPRHGEKHDEPIQETENLSEFHCRGDHSQGGRDRQSSPSATFESPQIQHEATLRTTAGSRLRSSPKESEDSHLPVDATAGGRKIPERLDAGAGRVGKGQENDLRGERHLRKSEASLTPYERRVRPRLDGPAATGRGEETEEASTKIVRPSRPSGGKDRHSKVNTAKGPRDRRVRLSVPTAVQFYDVQDRLGYDQPSKAVEWLIKKAKAAIDELGRLPARGNDGPSTLSDITHASPYPHSLGGPVSVPSSCPPAGSFSAALNSPFGDHVGNRMSYFIDSSSEQGVPFGNHPAHTRDVVGGMGFSQAHLVAGQGQLAGLSFPLGQTDLSRGSPGCVDGGQPGEFTGRVESRFKARERARERVKEKCTGRDCGKVAGGGSSPPSLQSSPLDQNSMHGPFPIHNSMQSSVHSLSLQNQHPSPLQSSISSVFDTTLSGIMQSSQQGTLQNLIMQNPSLQSPLPDQVQSSLQHPFQASFESTLQLTSQSMTSLPNPGMQQQPHLQRSSLEGCTQRALHLGSGFTPRPCSSSFSEGASLSSSDFMSISSIPISHSLSMSELSSFGITSPSPIGPHLPTGNSAVQIPLGFSPGPPASAFRSRPTASSQSCSESQPYPQDLSRPQSQLILPPHNAAHVLASPGSSASSKASTSLYYAPTSSRMGGLQSVSPVQLESSSFSSIRNVSYNYQLLQMMSPGRASSSYQTSSSQLQMPARIQGLDDFDDELKSSPPSSPHVHP